MRRTGIDLSLTRCIVVDAEISRRFLKDGEPRTLRLHSFASIGLVDSAHALTAELKALADKRGFPKVAWVNLWDVASSHQYLRLPTARHAELEAAARRHGASVLGLDSRDVTVAVSIGAARGEPGHQSKTELSFFAASLEEIRNRLRPIIDAGFVVEGVTTPCGALWSQARLRRPALPGDVHAFVALGPHTSALAIFSNGNLLYARDVSWGYLETAVGPVTLVERDELANRLSAELRRSFLYLKQYWEPEVSQVFLCGDMPEIRSLTAPLIERLNIEVETLDTLEGIDAATLPKPSDRFTDEVATYRLASAIAVEPPPANLLPLDVTGERVNRTALRVFAAGAAAAVAFGAFLYTQADVQRQHAERQVAAVQRELSAVQPGVRAIGFAQQPQPPIDNEPRAALEALDTQGPRMAEMLEALAQATPDQITVKAVRVVLDDGAWHVSIDVLSASKSPAVARIAADSFFARLAQSPLFGLPVRPPSSRTLAGGAGIELTAEYAVRQ